MIKRLRQSSERGFSLLEILIAIAVLSISLTGILTFFGSSQQRTRQADAMTIANMLARQKMAEIILSLEGDLEKGIFPQTTKTDSGKFEGRFENYRWESEVKKVELPLPPGGGGDDSGGANPMMLFVKQLGLDEAIREVSLKIFWKVRDRETNFSVTTHLVKL